MARAAGHYRSSSRYGYLQILSIETAPQNPYGSRGSVEGAKLGRRSQGRWTKPEEATQYLEPTLLDYLVNKTALRF